MNNYSKNIFSLENKIIVVTGAGGLLGAKHCECIAANGGIPVLLDINLERLEKLAGTIESEYNVKAPYFKIDITAESEVKANCIHLMEKYGKIDGLINNAANNPHVEKTQEKPFSRLENFPIDDWNSDFAVGLTGSFLCVKHYGFQISKNESGGSIINISSDLGLIAPDQRLYEEQNIQDDMQKVKPVSYSVVKTGLIGLTRYLATYWAKENVRCNAICPGGIENNQPQDFLDKVSSRIPMGRLAQPTEYQGLIVFLLSEASSYINGSVIAADGGRTAW